MRDGEAGKAVHAALGEDALRASANRLIRDHDQPVPLREYVDTGLYPVPSKLWASYPWLHFYRRAVRPHGNPQFREQTPDGQQVGFTATPRSRPPIWIFGSIVIVKATRFQPAPPGKKRDWLERSMKPFS